MEGFAAMLTARETQNRGEDGGDGKLSGSQTTYEGIPRKCVVGGPTWVRLSPYVTRLSTLVPADRVAYVYSIETTRRLLGQESFAAAWAEGRL